MQWLPPLLLLLVRQLLAVELNGILRTPQFMLISQVQCETFYETHVPDQKCPSALTLPITRPHCGSDIRAHLVRDPSFQQTPRVMFIGPGSNGKTVVLMEDLSWPSQSNNSEGLRMNRVEMSRNTAGIMLDDGWVSYNDVTATIYDSEAQLLYVLTRFYKGVSRPHCLIFYVGNIYPPGSLTITLFSSFLLHEANRARWEWGIDHYEHRAYYTSRHGEHAVLHSLPASRLIAALKEGIHGTVAHSYNNELRSHFRVSGGAVFTYVTKPDLQVAYIRSIDNRDHNGIQCAVYTGANHQKLPALISTLVVRDDDFCLVRDGRNADLQACKDERMAWLAERNLVEAPMPTGTLAIVLFVITVILSLIILFLCICMCWMKRNLDSSYIEEPPRQVPYYPSAPGQYPDMDVSVDKWNTNY